VEFRPSRIRRGATIKRKASTIGREGVAISERPNLLPRLRSTLLPVRASMPLMTRITSGFRYR